MLAQTNKAGAKPPSSHPSTSWRDATSTNVVLLLCPHRPLLWPAVTQKGRPAKRTNVMALGLIMKPPSLYQFPVPPPRQPAQAEPVTVTVPCMSRSLTVYWSRCLCAPSFPLRLWVGHSCQVLCLARCAAWVPNVSGQRGEGQAERSESGKAGLCRQSFRDYSASFGGARFLVRVRFGFNVLILFIFYNFIKRWKNKKNAFFLLVFLFCFYD